jgi:hypothetical protein
MFMLVFLKYILTLLKRFYREILLRIRFLKEMNLLIMELVYIIRNSLWKDALLRITILLLDPLCSFAKNYACSM